jgi:hypothetical protein
VTNSPTCPMCGGASEWNFDGNKAVLCPKCLKLSADELVGQTLREFEAWLQERQDASFLGYFNCIALGVFMHAMQYRMHNPGKDHRASWYDFSNNPESNVETASTLFKLLRDGHWVNVNSSHLCEKLSQIHDSSFFGQWAVTMPLYTQVVKIAATPNTLMPTSRITPCDLRNLLYKGSESDDSK